MAETFTPDNLIGTQTPKSFVLTLKSGENVVRGEVLGYETTTDKLRSYNSGGSNGIQNFYGIAAETVDASGGDTKIVCYIQGEFNINSLVFGTSGDSATQAVINAARALGCILRTFTAA